MSSDDKRIETTSDDWLEFSESIERFSENLDAEEIVILKALIAQAGAELDFLALDADVEDTHQFQENLHPGVNLMNIRALADSYKTSFAKIVPGVIDPNKPIATGDRSTSVIWIE